MAYLKNWTDNFFQIFFMGTSWVAVSIINIKNSSEQRNDVTQKYPKKSILMGLTLPSTGMWRGEVFAISDCLVVFVIYPKFDWTLDKYSNVVIFELCVEPMSSTGLNHQLTQTIY